MLSFSIFPVCPQQGATTITQLEPVPRPKGIARLRCDFNVPPDPTDPDTGFLYIAWVIDTTSQLYAHLYDPDNPVSKALCWFFPPLRFRCVIDTTDTLYSETERLYFYGSQIGLSPVLHLPGSHCHKNWSLAVKPSLWRQGTSLQKKPYTLTNFMETVSTSYVQFTSCERPSSV